MQYFTQTLSDSHIHGALGLPGLLMVIILRSNVRYGHLFALSTYFLWMEHLLKRITKLFVQLGLLSMWMFLA